MWDFLGGALGGWFGYKGTKDQNIASAQQAEKAMAFSRESQEKQMRFQERMSGSAHQRQMADMRKAGLNPILSAKYGGSSSPAGSSAAGVAAPVKSKAEGAMNSALNAATIKTALNTARKTGYEADILAAEIPGAQFKEDWASALYRIWQEWFDDGDLFPASNKLMDTLNSAVSAFNPAAGRTKSREYKPMDKSHIKRQPRRIPRASERLYQLKKRKAFKEFNIKPRYERSNYPTSRRNR